MLEALTHPLLLLPLLLSPRPPPSDTPHARVKHSYGQDDDNVSGVVVRVVCEVEAEATIDQAEQKDRGTEVFVYLGVFRQRLA